MLEVQHLKKFVKNNKRFTALDRNAAMERLAGNSTDFSGNHAVQ